MGLVVSWAVIAQWSEHWQLKPETWVRFPVTTAFFLPESNPGPVRERCFRSTPNGVLMAHTPVVCQV